MLLKQRLLLLFIFMLGLMPGLAASPALAQSPSGECRPVARLFGETICQSEVALEEKHIGAIKQQFEDQGLDSETALKSRSVERLKDIVWERALARKFTPAQLQPTEEEISFYSKALSESLADSHRENIKAAEKVRTLLGTQQHNEQDRKKLETLLGSLETSIAFYEERESYNKDMPPEFHAMVEEAERGIAETAIRDWRVNKALYEEYGGRVALSDNAPLPADAYRKFIDYIRSEGGLVILDKNYRNIFGEIERYIASMDEFLPETGPGAHTEYFSTPFAIFEGQASPPPPQN